MKSRLADTARRDLSEDLLRMTPEQRLAVHLAHCQLVAQLCLAGQATHARRVPRRTMRTSSPGQSKLLMLDAAD